MLRAAKREARNSTQYRHAARELRAALCAVITQHKWLCVRERRERLRNTRPMSASGIVSTCEEVAQQDGSELERESDEMGR